MQLERTSRATIARLLTRPQVIIALIFCILSVTQFIRLASNRQAQRVTIDLSTDSTQVLTQQEVQLTIMENENLERPVFTQASMPQDTPGQLTVILGLIKDELSNENIWPDSLELPVLYYETTSSGSTVILNFKVETQPAISARNELRLLESLRRSFLQNGVTTLRILVNNQPADTFLGHIALEDTFE